MDLGSMEIVAFFVCCIIKIIHFVYGGNFQHGREDL